MHKLRIFEVIVLLSYLLILICIVFICHNSIPTKGNALFWIFIGLFIYSFAIHSTSLGTSLRKLNFSLIWGLISFIIFLFPLHYDCEFVDLFGHNSFPFMLPIFGFSIHHILRFAFISLYKYEPMTLWLSAYGSDYSTDLNRRSNVYDKWFTFLSNIGFLVVLFFFMTRR